MALLPGILGATGASEAASKLRSDPVLNHNFIVSLMDASGDLASVALSAASAIADVALGGFSECSGLEMSMKTEDYREGGNNGAVLHFANRVEWASITLKRGVASSTALWDWHYSFVEGKGRRRDGMIVLMNELHVPNNIWFFRRGLPVKYSGPQLNAAQNGVSIESLEIAHEGLFQVPFVGLASGLASGAVSVAVSGSVGL